MFCVLISFFNKCEVLNFLLYLENIRFLKLILIHYIKYFNGIYFVNINVMFERPMFTLYIHIIEKGVELRSVSSQLSWY